MVSWSKEKQDIRNGFGSWIEHLVMDRQIDIISAGTVEGHLPRIENSPQLSVRSSTKITGRPRNASELRKSLTTKKRVTYRKSAAAIAYIAPTIIQLSPHKLKEPIARPIAVHLRVFYRTPITSGSGADLNGELFYNCLQSNKGKSKGAGLIADDSWIGHKELSRLFDKVHPRVEWVIAELQVETG